MMKKIAAILLSLTVLSSTIVCADASASQYALEHPTFSNSTEYTPEEALTGLVVNGKSVDTSNLPKAFYQENGTAMVPAAVVCDMLGYVYEWDAEGGTLTIEDSVQKAVLTSGRRDVEFIGKLKIIDLSGTLEFGAAMAVIDGTAYVPAALFEVFFNEVVVTDEGVSISEVRYYTTDDGSDNISSGGYRVVVDGASVNTKGLPYAAYEENGVIMLPLRAVGEALGYKISWVPATGDIVMEDSIQKAVLHSGSPAAHFTWKLTNINLSGTIELEAAISIHGGNTYVPASLFELFFNEVSVEGAVIAVSPGMKELH